MKYEHHSIPHVHTKESFHQIALDSGDAVLIGFLRLEPGYDQKVAAMQFACDQAGNGLKVLVLGEDADRALLQTLALEGTPTFIFFHDGEEKGRILGNADGNRLARFIASSLLK